MKSYLEKHHRVSGVTGALIALIIAVVYINVLPKEATAAVGFQKIILTYGHSLCWLLLGGAAILWAITKKTKLSRVLVYMALAAYIIFIGTLLSLKFTSSQ